MKEEDIEKILRNLCDSEKFRLLYRIELVDLNKKLSSILGETGAKGGDYSSRRRKIYHHFFDDNGENAGNFKQMEIRLANLNVSVIEYFDAKTMFAYALLLNVLTKEFYKNKNFNMAFKVAMETLRKYFKNDELKFKDKPVKINVANLSAEQKFIVQANLMEYFNIGELFYNLYYDAEVEKEIKNKKASDDENGI